MVRLNIASAATARKTSAKRTKSEKETGLPTLIVRDEMARLVDTEEREVTILAYFTVLDAINSHWLISGCREFGFVGIVDCQGDSSAHKSTLVSRGSDGHQRVSQKNFVNTHCPPNQL